MSDHAHLISNGYESIEAPWSFHGWEDLNFPLPGSNDVQLISNGLDFTGVPCYPQDDAQCDAQYASTHVDMSSPQPSRAGVTRQPAEPESLAFSSSHSTVIQYRLPSISHLRQRVTTRPGPSPSPKFEDLEKVQKRLMSEGAAKFEEDLEKVQKRLTSEGADVGAVERLREIFPDGKITKAALYSDMTLDQQRTQGGKRKYMLLLEVKMHPNSSHGVHRCMLCPPLARVEYRNLGNALRHFRKNHFGLSSVCSYW